MRKKLFLAGTIWMVAFCVTVLAQGAPKIQFDQTVYDFGTTSQVETVTGTFKFKNVGDAVLKIEPPRPTCGCTVADLKPDTLQPGESGELTFSLNLGQTKAHLEKHIAITSNDPQTPETSLTIKVDYVPLYDVTPTMLMPTIPLGGRETNLFITITRADGKPLRIVRFNASKPWITATVAPDTKADAATARILIAAQPDGSPRRLNEFIQIFAGEGSNSPVSVVYLQGQVTGELSVNPETLYWNITDRAQVKASAPEALVTRRVMIRSVNGKKFELKNPTSTVAEIQLALLPKENGLAYEFVATLASAPEQSVSGNVSFETSVATQLKIELPVTVRVFKP